MPGAEITILQFLVTSDKGLVVGNDIRGDIGFAVAAEQVGLRPNQAHGALRNLLQKEEVTAESCGVGMRRIWATDTGSRRAKRFTEAAERRASRSVLPPSA